jgi:hypothetical protein
MNMISGIDEDALERLDGGCVGRPPAPPATAASASTSRTINAKTSKPVILQHTLSPCDMPLGPSSEGCSPLFYDHLKSAFSPYVQTP